jgi:hypothetical protein
MARFLIDVDNSDWLDEKWDTISEDETMEVHTLDDTTEGQFYMELTDDEITLNLFKAVHLAVVDHVEDLRDEDGDFFLEDTNDFDAKTVLEKALKHYNKLMK